MKDPIKILTDEHNLIKAAIEFSENIGKLIGKRDNEYDESARKLLAFFRGYGDRYHHHKEELILFPEMKKKNEMLEDGIIKEMLENHDNFRELLAGIETFLDNKDLLRAQQQMHIYAEALLDHIAVEDDEVFQVAESLFSEVELDSIYFRFVDCDSELGIDKKNEFEKLTSQFSKI